MYFYHAHALAFGERFDRPSQEVGGSDADCSLSSRGGRSSSQVGEFKFKDIIAFASAKTDLSWNKEANSGQEIYETHASVVIENLNILDMLKADRVVARLNCNHSPQNNTEPNIAITGSYFENLRIAGRSVQIEYAHEWLARHHLSSAISTEQNAAFECHTEGRCSFVTKVTGLDQEHGPEIKNLGSMIMIPGFGKVYLGEVIISAGHRWLNMFRIELDASGPSSIAGGSLVAVNTNRDEHLCPLQVINVWHGIQEWWRGSEEAMHLHKSAQGWTKNEDMEDGIFAKVKARYQFLVDRKYLSGLSRAEEEELSKLEAALDEMDRPFYDDALRQLRNLKHEEDSHS